MFTALHTAQVQLPMPVMVFMYCIQKVQVSQGKVDAWCCRAASSARNASLSMSALQEQKWIGGSIANQQKNIRMGLNGSGTRGRRGQLGPSNPQSPNLSQSF